MKELEHFAVFKVSTKRFKWYEMQNNAIETIKKNMTTNERYWEKEEATAVEMAVVEAYEKKHTK